MDQRQITDQITTYPHSMIKGLLTIEQMYEFANEIKVHFNEKGISVTIYDDNSYCSELNGTWNVVLSWRGEREDKGSLFSNTPAKSVKKMYTYTYIIIHGTDGNTYTGPLQNAEYIYDLKHVRFCEELYPEQFDILDQFLKQHEKTKMIELFPIKTDYERDRIIKQYEKYMGIINNNNIELTSLKRELGAHRIMKVSKDTECYEQKIKIINRKIESNNDKISRKIDHTDTLTKLCKAYKQCLSDYGYSI